MRELASAIYRQREEEHTDIDADFKLKDMDDFNRVCNKYRDEANLTKLVRSNLIKVLFKLYFKTNFLYCVFAEKSVIETWRLGRQSRCQKHHCLFFPKEAGKSFSWDGKKGNSKLKDTPIGKAMLGIQSSAHSL